jgi:uncharacterized protein
MKSLTDIVKILSDCQPLIKKKYKINQLGIFGSYARSEQSESSDLDILIDYQEAPTLIQLIELENDLSKAVGEKVDVVTKKGLKPRIARRVLSEVIYV